MRDQFSKEAISYAPWAMSKAGLAKNCPFAFNCQYVRKGTSKTNATGKATRIGIAVHDALEGYLTGETLRKALYQAVTKARLTTNEVEDVMSYARNIQNFKERLGKFREKHSVKKIHVEKEFGFDIDMNPVDFFERNETPDESGSYGYTVFFRGKWDVVLETADGHVLILDHKSGEAPDDETLLARHDKQRKFYAIAALTAFPDMVGLKTAFHYVSSESIVWTPGIDTPEKIRKEFVPWYVEYINDAAAQAKTNTVGRKDWYCNFCSYTHLCPDHIAR